MKSEELLEVRKTYILAKALNTQYSFIREFVNPELKKSINEAKAKNSYFIKQLESALQKKAGSGYTDQEEEISFLLLEYLEKIKDVDNQNTLTSGVKP
jgi:hypothetical protein